MKEYLKIYIASGRLSMYTYSCANAIPVSQILAMSFLFHEEERSMLLAMQTYAAIITTRAEVIGKSLA